MFSSIPFKEVETSQIKGNIESSETIIRVACVKNPDKNFLFIDRL